MEKDRVSRKARHDDRGIASAIRPHPAARGIELTPTNQQEPAELGIPAMTFLFYT